MEFKEAMRIWGRMCDGINGGSCSGCPIYEASDDVCRKWVTKHSSEAEAILAKWAAEHPEKTIMDDFFEKHPKAPKCDDGLPGVCAEKMGYTSECVRAPDGKARCNDCWRKPLEEIQ